MRRYELIEGTSRKFWEIELDGESFTTRWGRIGATGQEKSQDFDTPAEARKAHDKLVAEKEKKGYKLVGSDEPGARPLTASTPSNPGLEGDLAASPDDTRAWQVYADWLLEQGEAWGAVMNAALGGKPDTAQQERVEKELFGGSDGVDVGWEHGVMSRISFCPEEYDEESPPGATLERVLRHPAGHLVRELVLGLPPCEEGDTQWHMEGVAKAVAAAGPLPLLARLDMSPPAEHMDQNSWRRLGDVRGIWKAAPRLREVVFEGSGGSDDGAPAKLGPIEAPHLVRLRFQSSGLDASVPKDIGSATLPALEDLELWFGQEDYGCSSTVKHLAGILSGEGLPKLRRLALRNSMWEQELVEALARSAILPRLESLDLSMGVLFRDAAKALLANAKAFAHLKQLVLDDNYVQDDDAAALRKAIPGVVIGDQKDLDGDEDDPYARYVSCGE